MYSYEGNSYYFYDYVWEEAVVVDNGLELIERGAEAVKFHYNLIWDSSSLRELGAVLSSNKTLKGLYLAGPPPLDIEFHKINNIYFSCVFDSLKINCTLQTLDLRDLHLGDDLIVELCAALMRNNSIEYIDLLNNNIGNSGGESIGKFLAKTETLRYIYVEQNSSIKPWGLHQMIRGLQENTSVVCCSFLGIAGNENTVAELADLLVKNDTIQELWCPQRHYHANESTLLKNAMKSNTSLLKVFDLPVDDADLRRNRKLFQQRVLDSVSFLNKVSWMRCKLMIVGEGRAGKSAFVRSVTGAKFTNLESTIGASVTRTRTAANGSSWGKTEKGHKSNYFDSFIGKEIMSKNGLKSQDRKPKRKVNAKGKTKIKTIGNNEENVEKSVDKENNNPVYLVKEEEIARKFDAKMVARSSAAQDTIDFTIWDYGGQRVFYAMHHLFLTETGVYVLVFDMRKLLFEEEEESLDYIKFWLDSVSLHAGSAPVFIVGTFLDVIKQDKLGSVNKTLGKLLQAHKYPQIIYNFSQDLFFFPVSNRKGQGIDTIREAITKTANEQSFVHQKIPVRWVRCLDLMLAENAPWLSFSQVQELAKKTKMTSVEEINTMLQLFHSLGMIINFNTTPALRGIITLDPQWLVDSISKVIRDQDLHGFSPEELEKVGLRAEVEDMFQNALVSDDLLTYFWENKTRPFLTSLMQHTLLMSDWLFSQEKDDSRYYLVPSLLQEDPEKTKSWRSDTDHYQCNIEFRRGCGFLPYGVFQRLVALCAAHSGRSQGGTQNQRKMLPLLELNSCKVWFDDNPVMLEKYGNSIRIHINQSNAREDFPVSCLRIIESMLYKVNSDTMKGGLGWDIEFEDTKRKGHFISYADAKNLSLKPWFFGGDSVKASKEGCENVDLNIFLDAI